MPVLRTPAERFALLARTRTVAMVGASANTTRPSYFVFSYLRTATQYAIAPVNPTLSEIDGIRAYPTLAAYASAVGPPDIVDVFRRPAETPATTREAIAVGARAIWFQYGVASDEAIALAEAAGLDVVVDRCIKVETARFDGGLASAGMLTGLVSARRRTPLTVKR